MDPLSITSASVGLAAAVYKCAIEVKRIVGTITDAADSLSDLAEEAQLIQGALQGVEDALRDNQEAISRYKVEDVFSTAVKGCRATLACIKQEFELLFNRSDWKSRFLVLWKEDDMKRLLGRLDRKRENILLLLHLLSLSSVREVQALVAKNQGALTVAKEDITALIPTYWSCRDTILDSLDKETVDSIYADSDNRESKLSTTEFDIDYELINTRVYRRALAKAQRQRSRPRRDLDHPALDLNDGNMEPVEDLIDLSWEPSPKTTLMPSHIPCQSYTDLAGLQFMPMAAHKATADAGRQNETQQDDPIPNEVPQTRDPNSSTSPTGPSKTYRIPSNKATNSQTSLLIEYFEGGRGKAGPNSKRPSVRVRPYPGKKIVSAKQHPETSRIDAASSMPSTDMRPGTQSYTSSTQPSQSTQADKGSPPFTNNPKLLEDIEDDIRRLILPELDARKREEAQRERTLQEWAPRERDPHRRSIREKKHLFPPEEDTSPRPLTRKDYS
ncbi:hypothetical protein FPOA_00120 [Fusarium poae]|uniref:Fungal N-terminal domain-containing protein n=1 Tax=Fusarium poae TaxID=36050 RepID=A0A1B8B0B7_FUSPO|nr:hypothetical protein FPOA_00120 [Fusarium poae]